MKKRIDILTVTFVIISAIAGLLLSLFKPAGIFGFIIYVLVFIGILGLFFLIKSKIK